MGGDLGLTCVAPVGYRPRSCWVQKSQCVTGAQHVEFYTRTFPSPSALLTHGRVGISIAICTQSPKRTSIFCPLIGHSAFSYTIVEISKKSPHVIGGIRSFRAGRPACLAEARGRGGGREGQKRRAPNNGLKRKKCLEKKKLPCAPVEFLVSRCGTLYPLPSQSSLQLITGSSVLYLCVQVDSSTGMMSPWPKARSPGQAIMAPLSMQYLSSVA